MMIFSDLWSKWEEFNGINSEPSQIPEEKLWFVCVVLGRLLLSLWCWLRSAASSCASWTITWIGCRLVSGNFFGVQVLTRDVTTFVTSETEIDFRRAILDEVTNFLAECEEADYSKCSTIKICFDLPVIAAYLVFLAITVSRFVPCNEIRIIIFVLGGTEFCSLTNIVATVAAFLLLLTISSL